MADQEKTTLNNLLVFFIALMVIFLFLDWLFFTGIYAPNMTKFWKSALPFFYKFNKYDFFIRIIYTLFLVLLIWLIPRFKVTKDMEKKHKSTYLILFFIISAVFIYGYTDIKIYDYFVYPGVFIIQIPITVRAISMLKGNIKEDKAPVGVNRETSGFMFTHNTEKGPHHIHKPQQHIWVEGAPGSGKSASIIKPIIKQCGDNGYGGLIYDFEGDPREAGAPLLGNIAYSSVLDNKKKKGKDYKLNFSFINFNDPAKSVRVNPLSKRYIEQRLDIQDLIYNLMSNLSAKGEKEDFWQKYGTSYIYGITWHLFKNYPEYATIPHVVATSLYGIDAVMRWALEDDEVRRIMAPLASAWEKKASGQLAGAETSGQLPISVLDNEMIFYILSEDQFNLDITNKDNPYLLCIGNSKKMQQALSPVISCLFTIIMKQMNSAGKVSSVFCFDEFPTVKVNGIDHFIATVRKHNCSVILGLQDYYQAEREYGKTNAQILRTNCSNQYFGLTSNPDTAKYASSIFGEVKKQHLSVTTNIDSMSQSESLQREKYKQETAIFNQDIGHFVGKIAGGKPPLFDLQFDEFKYKEKEIPAFNYPIKTGDESKDKEILKKDVQRNYEKIHNDINQLLSQYKQTEEDE